MRLSVDFVLYFQSVCWCKQELTISSFFPFFPYTAPEKPAPPIVGKVTFNSIELYWDQIAGTEDSSGGRLRYCVQEEEEEGRKGFGNVYKYGAI